VHFHYIKGFLWQQITSALVYAAQAYNNFPITGGDMATRGEAVNNDLKTLTHEIENQHSSFGNFFEEIPIHKSEKNAEKTLGNGNTADTQANNFQAIFPT
jgi:hypothetical protein